jgi:hypothetical protein
MQFMFKNLLIALLLLGLSFSLHAQHILNGGFEDSTFTVTDTVPTHWSVDYFGFGFTSDAHSGNSAAVIWNWYSYAIGWLIYGTAASTFDDGQGQPISINPDKLTGYYKYIYDDNGGDPDSAVCEILIYSHQNFTGARDTIAHAIHKLGPQATYEQFEVPILYEQPAPIADSILIRFYSSENGFCTPSTECLYLYLDDIEVSTLTGLSHSLEIQPQVQVYPSPSAQGFTVRTDDPARYPCELRLMDVAGRTVFSTTLAKPGLAPIHPNVPSGNYIWEIRDNAKMRHTGKWTAQ